MTGDFFSDFEPSPCQISDAIDAWNDFLGNNQTSYNRYTGTIDPNRIFSADGTRSIRFGNHEMDSWGTSKAHFRFEEWIYDASSNSVTYYNRLQRLR